MEKSNSQLREERILDSAAELIAHYGYDKTTVSDIAKTAAISKGAIYLHFKSKDALFETLLVREMQVYAEKWLSLIEADPNGGTIAALYKNSLYAMNSSPFLSAMFRQDSRVFGSYLRKPDNFFRKFREEQEQEQSDRLLFVRMMQDAGAMRIDVSAEIIAHIMDILSYGLVGMENIMDKSAIPPIDNVIEGIAALMDRALTPAGGGNPERVRAILVQIADAGRAQLMQSMQEKNDDD